MKLPTWCKLNYKRENSKVPTIIILITQFWFLSVGKYLDRGKCYNPMVSVGSSHTMNCRDFGAIRAGEIDHLLIFCPILQISSSVGFSLIVDFKDFFASLGNSVKISENPNGSLETFISRILNEWARRWTKGLQSSTNYCGEQKLVCFQTVGSVKSGKITITGQSPTISHCLRPQSGHEQLLNIQRGWRGIAIDGLNGIMIQFSSSILRGRELHKSSRSRLGQLNRQLMWI